MSSVNNPGNRDLSGMQVQLANRHPFEGTFTGIADKHPPCLTEALTWLLVAATFANRAWETLARFISC